MLIKKESYDKKHININIPEECTPAIAAYVKTMTIDSHTIIATILDLLRKGYLEIDKSDKEAKKQCNGESYIITIVKESDESLLNHEKYFIDWIINKIGNGVYVTTDEIINFGKKNRSIFKKQFTGWQKIIKEDSVNKGYFDKSKAKNGVFLTLISAILVITGILIIANKITLGIISILLSVFLLLYGTTLFFKYTKLGLAEKEKWLKYKKYISELVTLSSNIDYLEAPQDIDLIYGLSLGISKSNSFANSINMAFKSITRDTAPNLFGG